MSAENEKRSQVEYFAALTVAIVFLRELAKNSITDRRRRVSMEAEREIARLENERHNLFPGKS